MSTLYNFSYTSSSGNVYYGVVAADPNSQYNYSSGQTYQSDGGTYAIGQPAYTGSTAAAGTVYCTQYYDKATNSDYTSYHYDEATNQYYQVSALPYQASGSYNGVSMAAGYNGLGSEYDYARSSNGTYHVYGGGGQAHAEITPSSVGTHNYDFKFTYHDGSYYTGTVTDDGTFGYSSGYSKATSYGTYQITGMDPTAPSASEMAGYVYTKSYYDAVNGSTYTPYSDTSGNAYYGKPDGYGGLGTESNYVHLAAGYYKYGSGGQYEASAGTPLSAVPPPT